MVLSGAWGDREGIFAPFFFFLNSEGFQPVQGSYGRVTTGRLRGGDKGQSKGHSAQNVWEEAPVGKPWQVWPLEMAGLTDGPKEPFPWCLHSPLLSAQPLTHLYLESLGIISMALSPWH